MLDWQRNVILVRDLTQTVVRAPLAAPLEHHLVSAPTDPAYAAIDRFCSAQKFPGDWSLQMLQQGAVAQIICRNADVVAAGWSVSREFFVSEIGRRFCPGEKADYYFGDFVAPDFRGQGLQRTLIQKRLLASQSAGRISAAAMTLQSNHHSLANYQAEGFVVSAELHILGKGRLRLHRLNRQPAYSSRWMLCGPSLKLPILGRLIWSRS